MTQPVSYVCQGKHCARARAHDALLRALRKVSDVHLVRCQKVCDGSVVGTEIGGKLLWFERVDSPKLAVALKQLVVQGTKQDLGRLKKCRMKDRTGRSPR